MSEIIGARHEFHDEKYAAEWADYSVPTPERLELFNVILSEIKSQIPPDGCIVELGIGPGILAIFLMKALPNIQYYGIDFSSSMLDIAQKRLTPYLSRVVFLQKDLVNDDWWIEIPIPVDVIVSTWVLHDLGSQENIEGVYKKCAQVLQEDGMLLNGDFIKPDKAIYEYEPGRFEIAKHLAILHRVGFNTAE